MIDYIVEITKLLGKLKVTDALSSNPILRHSKRIRTIHGSLVIEQNKSIELEGIGHIL